jgi:nanoRNase/pAp phosphatase (c-di-AMP/oligoRNAs hydrolase)
MDNVKQQIIERIKQSTNVLVTVNSNPTLDQLAACIGLTLMLNKLGKHATAVYSGETPSILEFLQPEKTIEKNTDSLRDFIISLDKSKADKLRYKVEDKVVKIFITPYKTSISEKDLVFSEGDFNVDLIIALGVHDQGQLDQAIAAHGRILHDATVISINDSANGTLGSLNLLDQTASSLSELVTQFDGQIGKPVLDAQISTALLTGIVAQTDRFSNDKTSPTTMSVSSKLMSAGANQQLVSVKLEESAPPPPPPPPPPPAPAPPNNVPPPPSPVEVKPPADGAIQIAHETEPEAEPEANNTEIRIDPAGTLHNQFSDDYEVPDLSSQITSEPVATTSAMPAPEPTLAPNTPGDTPDLGNARGAVESAMDSQPATQLPPIAALNAQSVFDSHDSLFDAPGDEERPSGEPSYGMPQLLDQQFRSSINPSTGASVAPVLQDQPQNTMDMPMPTIQPLPPQPPAGPPAVSEVDATNLPPPVPPPMMPFSPPPGSL